MWEGRSEADSSYRGVGAELDPEDVADDGRVVGWQRAATEAVHQSPRGVALPDLQVVVAAVGAPLQLEPSTKGKK